MHRCCSGVAWWVHGRLSWWRTDQATVRGDVQQNLPRGKSRQIQWDHLPYLRCWQVKLLHFKIFLYFQWCQEWNHRLQRVHVGTARDLVWNSGGEVVLGIQDVWHWWKWFHWLQWIEEVKNRATLPREMFIRPHENFLWSGTFDKIIFSFFRTIFAVYEMVGTEADQSKAEELFNRLDMNADGSISQEEFISIVKQDHNLLNILQRVQ